MAMVSLLNAICSAGLDKQLSGVERQFIWLLLAL